MKQDIMHKILSEHQELSSLPQVVTEIIKVSRDENASSAAIAKVIMKDPNLTTRLLRVVNSPFYGSTRPITTINQAVMTMGQRAVTALALAASIHNMVDGVKSTIDRKKFWRHSLEVALASQSIARAVKYESPEEAFICGLLHDIGSLVLEASYPEEVKKMWKLSENGEPIVELEESNWGTNHARVGQFLLRQWGLPEILGEAVGGHHLDFGPEDNHPYQRIILIVNLANRISKFNIGNIPPPEANQIEIRKTLTAQIGLTEKSLEEIERSLIGEVVSESGFLEIDVGTIEEILKEANGLLFDQYLTTESLLQENQVLKNATNISSDVDGERFEFVNKALSLFGHCLKDVTKVVSNRALILKTAVSRGDIKDKGSIVVKSAETLAESADTINLLLDELKNIGENEILNEKQLSKIKEKIDIHLKGIEKTDIVEPVV